MAEISKNSPENALKMVQNGEIINETHVISPKTGAKVHVNTLSNLVPAKKGEVRNPHGKAVGTKTDKRKQWEVLHESIAGVHTDRFNRVLSKLDDKEFMDNYLRILEYFKPRLQRAENINANVELDKVVLNLNGDMAIDLPSNFDETDTERGGVGDFVNEELPNDDANNVENEPE
jgi:hypothetical protein